MADGRRYQVFVSSTFLDLKEEREAVVSALLQMEAFPAGMELFPAADDDAWTLIKRVIDESDYYLLVIGGKYGSIDQDSDLSYTEKEYDYAVEQGKPVLAFLHGEPDKIEAGKSEKKEEAQAKLEAFRKKVEESKHVKYWTGGPDDLAGKLALSFSSFKEAYSAVGWVRGDVETSTEALKENNELRKELEALRQALTRSGPSDETAGLAQGDDTTNFKFVVRAIGRGSETGELINFKKLYDLDATWDGLFSILASEMLNEADEAKLRKRLRSWIEEQHGATVRENLPRTRLKHGNTVEEITEATNASYDLQDEDFTTLIIQLRALGLIAKSDRQRSVKDTKTYWRLTDYGDDHLTALRAIRKDEPAQENPA